jgi:hypothetical protein
MKSPRAGWGVRPQKSELRLAPGACEAPAGALGQSSEPKPIDIARSGY